MMPDPSDKQAADNASPCGPSASRSGEGAETALQALIKTRRGNGDEPPAAETNSQPPAADAPA